MLFNLARFTLLSISGFICMSSGDVVSNSTSNLNATGVPFTVIVLCSNSKYFCTGVIVDVKWVLTVAHCLHDLSGDLTEDNNSVLVVAGTSGLNEAKADIKSGKAQIRKSKKIVVHEEYIWDQKFVNDIALIEVSEAFATPGNVAVAVLNSTELVAEPVFSGKHDVHGEEINMMCRGYGYGRVVGSDDDAESSVKEQDHVVDKHCHCLERIRSYKSPLDILRQRNIFICDSDTKKGFVAGDNGGPLLCNGALRAVATAKFYYTKIVDCKMADYSSHTEDGEIEMLDVFTDLCYFGQWLSSSVKSYPHLDELCKVVDDW